MSSTIFCFTTICFSLCFGAKSCTNLCFNVRVSRTQTTRRDTETSKSAVWNSHNHSIYFCVSFFFLGGGFQNRQILFYSTAHIHIHTVLFHIVNDKLMRMCSTLGRVYHFAVASLNSTFPVLPKNLAPSMLLYNKSIARDRGSSTQTGGTTRASELDVERDVVCFDWWRRKDSIFASSPVCFDYISSNPLRRNLRRSEVRSVSTGTPRAIRQSCRCCRLRPLRRPACRSSPPWIPPRRGAKSSRTR